MPITLVLDQGVPRDAAGRLRDLGYDCVHVGEVGMSKAADEDILRFALGKNGVVVTLDADFHAILAVSGAVGPSVIRIRIQGLRAADIVEYLRFVSVHFESELTAGSLVTVKRARRHVTGFLSAGPAETETVGRLSFLTRPNAQDMPVLRVVRIVRIHTEGEATFHVAGPRRRPSFPGLGTGSRRAFLNHPAESGCDYRRRSIARRSGYGARVPSPTAEYERAR